MSRNTTIASNASLRSSAASSSRSADVNGASHEPRAARAAARNFALELREPCAMDALYERIQSAEYLFRSIPNSRTLDHSTRALRDFRRIKHRVAWRQYARHHDEGRSARVAIDERVTVEAAAAGPMSNGHIVCGELACSAAVGEIASPAERGDCSGVQNSSLLESSSSSSSSSLLSA